MRRTGNRGFTLVELLVVICIIGLLAALLLPAIAKALCAGKQGAMRGIIDQLTTAAKSYELDNGAFPPSNREYESHMIVNALKYSGPKSKAYFDFKDGMLDEKGNLIDTIQFGEVIFYRNNQANYPKNVKDPEVHNKQTIDLWGMDCAKQAKGCNNWE